MFGLSFTHLVLLAVLALIFLGPEQLPEVARTIARLLNEWKRATGDIQSHLTSTLREDFNLNKMVDPHLAEQAKKDHDLPPAPHIQPAEHIAAQGPTMITNPHASQEPITTGHTEPHKPDDEGSEA